MISKKTGISNVVPMCQEDEINAAEFFETPDKRFDELRRVDQPVSIRMTNEITVAAEGFWRVEAAVVDRIFDKERKVGHRFLGIIAPQTTNGTCGA